MFIWLCSRIPDIRGGISAKQVTLSALRSYSLHLGVFLLVYNLALRAYHTGIRIASLWNAKARLWVDGRKDVFERVRAAMAAENRTVVWMHSASLGEFEQGRFLIENIRREYPQVCIVVTFFSPSGYEVIKNYKGADHIFYLPFPTRRNASRFVSLLKPTLVLWIKYDYWYHYLDVLRKRNIPLLLISAIFLRHHPFFKWYGSVYRKMLSCFSWLFVQTPGSAKRLSSIGISSNVTVNGDTRFDRVIDVANRPEDVPGIAEFVNDHPAIVAGSTWPDDEEELDHYANTHPDLRFIVAPHEISEAHLQEIEKLFQLTVRYSEWIVASSDAGKSTANTLIIDNIGMLSKLYRYATICYVGGGFGNDGVHNVLEAAVYGKPVIFGPVFNKFREAIELLEEGGAITVNSAIELESAFDKLFSDADYYGETSRAAHAYVHAHRGATENILRYIQANRLLTS